MSEKEKKYNPADKYNWSPDDFAVVLEPHETKGLTDEEILKLVDERMKSKKNTDSDQTK